MPRQLPSEQTITAYSPEAFVAGQPPDLDSFPAGGPALLSEASRRLGRLTALEAMVLECGLHSARLWLERLGTEDARTACPVVAETRVGP